MPTPHLELRKPSKASPEAIAAFVGNAQDDAVSATLNTSDETTPEVAVASAAETPALRAVPRKKLANPSPPPASTVTPSFRRASHAVEQRRTRPARRRTTVYFDVEIATELAGVLAARDQELSDAVNAAVRAWLKGIK